MITIFYKDNQYTKPHPKQGIFLTFKQTMEYLQISQIELLSLIEQGKLPVYIFGLDRTYWRIWSGDIESYRIVQKVSAPNQETMEQIRKELQINHV